MALSRLWDCVVRPLLAAAEPEVVVEVGAERGATTFALLPWAQDRGAHVHVIEPSPQFDPEGLLRDFPGVVSLHVCPSLEALPGIPPADAVLLDGDHNWFTVISELRLLDDTARRGGLVPPLVLLHDVDWPYGRRDLYYAPERIPPEHLQPHARRGMAPGTGTLVDGGFNAHLHNAAHEAGPRNGVRTAVEDFMRDRRERYDFHDLPGLHGIGLLVPRERLRKPELAAQLERLRSPEFLLDHVRLLERERIEAAWRYEQTVGALERRRAESMQHIRALERELTQVKDHSARQEAAARSAGERADALQRELTELKECSARQQASAENALRRLVEDRNRVAELAQALARSRSWRYGHGVSMMMRRLTRRRVVGRSAVQLILERSRQSVALPLPEQGTDSEDPEPASLVRVAVHREPISEQALEHLDAAPPVTIVMPVHNAAAELRRSLYSIVRHTTLAAHLLLIDDASTDPAVDEILAEYADLPGVTVVRNEQNIGFTRTANRGFDESRGDVVLVNSDIEVGPRWLELLREAAYSDPSIATVTPVSNNAGAFSVPRPGEDNPVPGWLTREQVSRYVMQTSAGTLPRAPTGNGFCMYVKRALLDEVGGFDAERFPVGYGEENDLCMRAGTAGWTHVVDDRVFVHHVRTSSFGEARKAELAARARKTVDALHPGYTDAVRAFVDGEEMHAVRARVAWAFGQAASARIRPRVLYVVHDGSGGTPGTNLDLMRGLADRYEPCVLTSDGSELTLSAVAGERLETLARWRLRERWSATRFSDPQYREVVRKVLSRYAIELVHVRHLFKHTLDLPGIARAMGIPIVLSIHDFYLTCPTVHLLDETGTHCGGICTEGADDCRPISPMLADVPPLKHRWIGTWREAIRRHVVEQADVAVTTSPYARDVHRRVFPTSPEHFAVIEHGRDLDMNGALAQPPVDGEAIRVLVPGNLEVHKGAELLARVLELDADAGRLELHFMGEVPDRYSRLGVQHGRYERHEFRARVAEISPHVVAVLSIYPETYCHVLSEAWACGVPVLATDIGALHERVSEHGGGWLVPLDAPHAVYQRLLSLAEDPDEYRRVAGSISRAAIRTVQAMADDYDELYQSVISRRGVLRPAGGAARPSLRPRILRATAFVPGRPSDAPGSTYVRTLNRLTHPDVAWKLRLHVPERKAAEGLHHSCDLVLVQRTAVAPPDVAPLLEWLDRTGTPLLVDLDDDLLSVGIDHPEYGPFADALPDLLQAATIVTVSTETLRKRLLPATESVVLVPNMLDERLWCAPVARDEAPRRAGGPLRLVYIGTRTHGEDLLLLKDVLRALRDDAGVQAELEVIGGERPGPGQDWYRRVDVPRRLASYPRFVKWLRSRAAAWDVAVAPLVDSPFNRAKSDLKFLEYSALGLPGVYSRSPAYDGCDRDGRAQMADNVAEWVHAITGLTDAEERRAMASAAREHVLRHRVLSCDASDYLDLLSAAVLGAPRAAALSAGARAREAG